MLRADLALLPEAVLARCVDAVYTPSCFWSGISSGKIEMADSGFKDEPVRFELYLGSQQYEDDVLLAFHEAVARRLLTDSSEVISGARALLERWVGLDDFNHAEQAYMRRWKAMLDPGEAEFIASAIIERSDEGRFLRQCSPFARSLSDDERHSIRKECEARMLDRFGSAGG